MNPPARHRSYVFSRTQRGAVLYVALIMLILMALLGIAGMQVAGMQEKMASNYRAANRAFQNAEGVVRAAERSAEAIANGESVDAASLLQDGDISPICDDGYDPALWAEDQLGNATAAVNVRQIDSCVMGESSMAMGAPVGEASPIFIYQITGYATDDADANSSSVVVDTIFKL